MVVEELPEPADPKCGKHDHDQRDRGNEERKVFHDGETVTSRKGRDKVVRQTGDLIRGGILWSGESLDSFGACRNE